ncbi:hypothetical protein GFS31_00180 [Leptolyngbya sp. BL0902]|nr:hypothetical protein GFS31_00180 [Leptolyngbya sp. BL0902]
MSGRLGDKAGEKAKFKMQNAKCKMQNAKFFAARGYLPQ